jgi:cardiolipin synthase A/B
VYNSAGINNTTFDILSQAGIDIQRSSNDVYDLNHAKYILIDDMVIISTGNLTASTFSKNRDIFVHIFDPNIVKTMESIFFNDFTSKYIPTYHHSLVISPWDSRQKILYIIKNASSSLQIYMPYMDDSEIANTILDTLKKGVKIQIIS